MEKGRRAEGQKEPPALLLLSLYAPGFFRYLPSQS
jgi:hypothetical protein